MEKPIHIDNQLLKRIERLSALEQLSVVDFIEQALEKCVARTEKKRFAKMTKEEREDLGLLQLMKEVELDDTVDEETFLEALHAR